MRADRPRPESAGVLEAVVNVSEGRDEAVIAAIGAAGGDCLLDVHADAHHHRSVYTLAGEPAAVERAVLDVALRAIALVDLGTHEGVHPRLGVVDVIPFVPYTVPVARALAARARVANKLAEAGVPCFFYGPERTLPEVRKGAFTTLSPDVGPPVPHGRAGASCVGVRPVLVAYNLVVDADLETARLVARRLRRPTIRALAFRTGEETQVSFNLVEPATAGPELVYDEVAALIGVKRAELVGLIPDDVLAAVPPSRHLELDLSPERTVEARLARAPARPPARA